MAISKRTRFEVLKRDNHTCRYCGAQAPDVKLHVDHVNPVALGGGDTADNLVAACVDCNLGKASSHPDPSTVANVAQDAIRWAAAIKEAAKIDREADNKTLDYRGKVFDRIEYHDDNRDRFWLPANWEQSIIAFHDAGLPIETLIDCIDVAAEAYGVYPKNRFRYMCGVAWKRIARLQDIAKDILAAENDQK